MPAKGERRLPAIMLAARVVGFIIALAMFGVTRPVQNDPNCVSTSQHQSAPVSTARALKHTEVTEL